MPSTPSFTGGENRQHRFQRQAIRKYLDIRNTLTRQASCCLVPLFEPNLHIVLELRRVLLRSQRFMPINWPSSVSPPAITYVLILLLFILQQGCETTPTESWKTPLTEDTRRTIVTVGIMVSEELPRVTVDLPSKGAASGAGRKAGKWAGN